jgi:hypothetical protein
MDELLNNFTQYITNNFSTHLGSELIEYLNNNVNPYSDITEEDYAQVEYDIKTIINNYLINNNEEMPQIARNLYEAYIDYDDQSLIKATKFMIRIYTKFSNMNLKKKFNKWRINMLFYKPKKSSLVNENDIIEPKQQIFTNNSKRQNDVFNRLYMESYKKDDDRILNDELKKIKEQSQGTFKPNIYRK